MHRFYIAPENWDTGNVILRDAEAHHARDVLRLKNGDRVVLFNGRGREITADIVDLAKNESRLRTLHQSETQPLRCRITLGQAIPKGKNMDLIVQKAVEIGAAEIFPLLSARTVVQLDAESATQKQAKWQTVALEAAKQCGQNWLPQVHVPRTPDDFFAAANVTSHDLCLIGSLQPGAQHLKKILADYAEAHADARQIGRAHA